MKEHRQAQKTSWCMTLSTRNVQKDQLQKEKVDQGLGRAGVEGVFIADEHGEHFQMVVVILKLYALNYILTVGEFNGV